MLIGHHHALKVHAIESNAIVLDAGRDGKIPLNAGEAPGARVGDTLEVFVHTDARAMPVATTARAAATLGRCACLRVAALADAGAFLDWGLKKHLLLPWAEQRRPLEVGQLECILVYQDNSGRLAASSRLDHHLDTQPEGFASGQRVALLICQRTDLGFKAVVDDCAVGLLYRNEIFQPVKVGSRVSGWVKHRRPDGRLDLSLQAPARDTQAALVERLYQALVDSGGRSELTDSSPPAAIQLAFGVSKRAYKRAIATLYRQRRIRIEADSIVLSESATASDQAEAGASDTDEN